MRKINAGALHQATAGKDVMLYGGRITHRCAEGTVTMNEGYHNR